MEAGRIRKKEEKQLLISTEFGTDTKKQRGGEPIINFDRVWRRAGLDIYI